MLLGGGNWGYSEYVRLLTDAHGSLPGGMTILQCGVLSPRRHPRVSSIIENQDQTNISSNSPFRRSSPITYSHATCLRWQRWNVMECQCGCGESVPNGSFKPGRDQRLRADLERRVGGIIALRELVEAGARYSRGQSGTGDLIKATEPGTYLH